MYASDLYMMIYNELFIYVNVIVHLKSDCKLYVDRTYLFFIFCEIHTSVNDLRVNIQPGFKGEKNFYPDPHKQFQEIVFSRKKINSSHTKERTKNPQLYILIKLFIQLQSTNILDWCLTQNQASNIYIRYIYILSQQSLMAVYESFVQSHLDYGHIVYDQALNESFYQNVGSI